MKGEGGAFIFSGSDLFFSEKEKVGGGGGETILSSAHGDDHLGKKGRGCPHRER